MVMTDAGVRQHAAGPGCELSVVMIDAGDRELKRRPCEQWDETVRIEPFHWCWTGMQTEDRNRIPATMDGIMDEIAIDERNRVVTERLDLPGSNPLRVRPWGLGQGQGGDRLSPYPDARPGAKKLDDLALMLF